MLDKLKKITTQRAQSLSGKIVWCSTG